MKIHKDKEWMIKYVEMVGVSYYFNGVKILKSECNSIDVNDHIDEVINKIINSNNAPYPGGRIDIYYVEKRMFTGDGPGISAASVKLIASIGAEIGQDIYCTCNK